MKCMEIAATYVPVLESASTLLAELDVLTSFAHVAAYSGSGYCRPEMTDGEEDGLGITVSCILLLFVSYVSYLSGGKSHVALLYTSIISLNKLVIHALNYKMT